MLVDGRGFSGVERKRREVGWTRGIRKWPDMRILNARLAWRWFDVFVHECVGIRVHLSQASADWVI